MFNSNCGTGILPVMNLNDNQNNGWMDGGMWAWWIIIFAMFGWGNGGFGWGGNGNNSNSQFTDAALQRGFDNQAVIGKLDRLGDGICNLGYDQLSQMNGINNTVQQTGWNLQQTMNQNENANMQRAFSFQQQLSDCCCENRVGQMQIQNQMATDTCALQNTMNQNNQQLMWANQQGFRDISDQINAGFQRIETNALMRENADLRQRLNDCNLNDALRAQSTYIVNEVSPRSHPAYITCNPNTGMTVPSAAFDQWYVMNQQANAWRNAQCCNQNTCCCNNGF